MHSVHKKFYSIMLTAVMLLGLCVTPVLAQNYPYPAPYSVSSPVYNLNYKLIAVDADTNGVLTKNTQRIKLGVMVENNSTGLNSNMPTQVFNTTFSNGALFTASNPQNVIATFNTNFTNIGPTNLVKRAFVYANSTPAVIKVLPNDVVLASLFVTTQVQTGPVTTATIKTLVEDIVYQPSSN